jgi:tripartite ATP-independent transporter DctP family solute receptor
MSYRHFVAAAACALLVAPVAGVAQDKQVWKAADVHPLGYPTVEAVERLGKKMQTATNGRISVQMYPQMQLGGEKEMIEQAQVGALQIARVSVGALGPVVDELNVFNMPFIFRDEAHMRKVIDGPIGAELLEKVTASPARLVALGWMDAGTRNVYSNKPVTKPADLKGMKVRMMGNPLFVETMNAMGGNGVAMGFNELYSAMQTGVVDGAENNEPTVLAQNHYQVAKIYSLTGHLIIPEMFVFSKASWDKLSKADQALLKKDAREAQFEQRKLWDEKTASATSELKAKGVQFIPADKQAFFKATQPVRDKYGAKYSALMKRILDTK